MAKCAFCDRTILFGGKKAEGLAFCNDKCLSSAQFALVADQVPEDIVFSQVREIHSGPCPVCGQSRGLVDVHTSHKVASFFVITSWSSAPRISCNTCGIKAKLGATVYSLVLGWWGVPWGFVMTPVQVLRNLVGLLSMETSMTPSAKLEQLVRLNIASQIFEEKKQSHCEAQDFSF